MKIIQLSYIMCCTFNSRQVLPMTDTRHRPGEAEWHVPYVPSRNAVIPARPGTSGVIQIALLLVVASVLLAAGEPC